MSFALARKLQEEEDAALAAALMAQDAAPVSAGQRQTVTTTGPLPGERLASAAHKSCQHMGRNTAKKIEARFCKGGQTLTLATLLMLFRSDQREEVLMLVDSGQRQRVEAELVALTLDFP